jgi:ABC-type polysaccharide/polyol phosphate export permease
MRNFWIQIKTYYKGLFEWIDWPAYIGNIIGLPAIMIFMYAYLGKFTPDVKATEYYSIGMSASVMTYALIAGITSGYANDRRSHTFTFLYISKVNRFLNFISRGLGHLPNGILIFLVALGVIKLVTAVDFGAINWGALVLAVVTVDLALCGFAELLGIFSIIYIDFLNVLAVSLGIIFLLSGIIIPLSALPSLIQEIAHFFPVSNGLIAMRAAFSGAPFADVYVHILREALNCIGYFTIGFIGFILFEKSAQRSGILYIEQDN